MCKKNLCFSLIMLFLLCFIPLGCEDDEVANSDATVSAKSGYIYAPVEPEIDKNGMAIGLIALEQSVAPKDYQPVKNAYVSIGISRSKTDEKGYFNISGLQPGEHEMLVSATGYIPVVQLTAVAGSSTATIAIDTMKIIPQEPLVIVNDMLQVTAVGKEMSGKFIPLNAITWSVFSEEDDKQDKASITNTGIFSATEAGNFKVIAASGTYNASTEVTVLSPADASTSTLTGEVTLSSGSPVEDATVIVSGTHLMTKTDEDGDYSILNVPADVSLTVFVIKNHTLIGSAPVSMEKWKEKSLDILASSDPLPVAEGEEGDVEIGQENKLTTGSLLGYVYVPADTEVKEGDSDDTNKETMVSITVSQLATVPDGYIALSGAKVIFENDPTIYSVTSTDGGFTLDNIPCKKDGEPYFVAVVMEGYVTTRVPVLFTGKYPTGIVTSIKIYPENPIVYLESSFEFKPVFYSREGEIIETSRVDWSVEGDVGTIDPNSGLFTPSRVGTGTVIVTYGDITERKNFTIVAKEEGGKLSGLVTDEENKPVEGAFVILDNYPWMAITDEKGAYEISFVPTDEKISVTVKINGKKCGSAIAAVSRGDMATEDIAIVLPVIEEETAVTEEQENIADTPPVSISPENPSSNTSIGVVPDSNSVSEADTEGGEGENNREEFPRWPEENESPDTHGDNSPEEFPRWPGATPANN